MKHLFLSVLSLLVVGGFGWTYATEDNQIIDALAELEDEMPTSIQEINESFKLNTFSSCEDMTTVLENYIKENFKDNRNRYYDGRDIMYSDEDFVTPTAPAVDAEESANTALKADGMGGGSMPGEAGDIAIDSSTTDYSTTNLQVKGVDEADILKSDGEYLYYYNQRVQQISILKSPLDIGSKTLDLNDAEVIKKINLPSNFYGSQLYLQDDKLVIVAQRWGNDNWYGFLQRSDKIDVIVYDISDVQNPKLTRFTDIDGYYTDSRMIDGKLYLVSQVGVNRGWAFQGVKNLEDIELDEEDVLPKAIDIAYTDDVKEQNLEIGDYEFPYRVGIHRPACDNIFYILPDKETVQQHGLNPTFTVVRVIDIDDSEKTLQTTTAFGATQQIHMSLDGLYLTQYFWTPAPFKCAANSRCILPWYGGGDNTLIHKFTVGNSGKVSYVDTRVIEGMPLSQYSMSEDAQGNFRILTTNRRDVQSTSLTILDDKLQPVGLLRNIEPGEEFKSSRYIGDKLYLVTFEQIDPLFVIDLADLTKPKIVGELKIPGFSTYLHPYAEMQDNVQYLIGLGVGTKESEWGGTTTDGIKVDLYKIDYNNIDQAGRVSVEQIHTQTRGSGGSDSEALYNPRMFVWDEERQLLVLPMILQKDTGGQYCNIEYDSNGNEIGRSCRPSYRHITTFAGIKAIDIDPTRGIHEEYSYDYTDLLKKDKQVYYDQAGEEIYTRQFNNLQWRAGYVGDALFAINNLFAHFAVMGTTQETYVDFDAYDVSGDDYGRIEPMMGGAADGVAIEEPVVNVVAPVAN